MGKDDDFWEGLAALMLGVLGLALISSWIKPKCPTCKKEIEKDSTSCPYCGTYLRWGQYDY